MVIFSPASRRGSRGRRRAAAAGGSVAVASSCTDSLAASRAPVGSSASASGRPSARSSTAVKVSVTSARPSGFRCRVPLKMTSSILPPRRFLADCSPSTQVMASTMLLLPQPFGPTMAVTPGWNRTSVASQKLLKPRSSSLSRRSMAGSDRAPVEAVRAAKRKMCAFKRCQTLKVAATGCQLLTCRAFPPARTTPVNRLGVRHTLGYNRRLRAAMV